MFACYQKDLVSSLLTVNSISQTETQSELRSNHDSILVRLEELKKAIDKANTRLNLTSAADDGQRIKEPTASDLPDLEDFEDADDFHSADTLRDCISTAETVRDDVELWRRSLFCVAENEPIDDEMNSSGELGLEQPETAEGSEYKMTGLESPDIPHGDQGLPLEVVSGLIDDLKQHAQKEFEANNFKRAESNLIEAIKHAEQREAKYGVPFEERRQLQEILATIYHKQNKWAEATKILRGLLQESDVSNPELAVEQAQQRSRQYLLLATIHYEMYQSRSSDQYSQKADDLQSAEGYAQQAFTKRYRLGGGPINQQDPNFLQAVQMLIQIHEAQGRTVLAKSYHRQFLINQQPASPSSLGAPISRSSIADSEFDVVDIDELLISAVKQGDQSNIQSLLLTANVNCRCDKGKFPLIYAVELGDEVTVRKLLDHGAEINAQTRSGTSALHQAVIKGDLNMARLLIELDADIEVKDNNLTSPLCKAVEKRHGLMVSYLLGQSADVNVRDKAGWTLLHHAAHNRAVDVLKHLLYPSHGIDVNATCPAGKTALHHCAELTLIEPAKVLLAHGANPDALDANSRSPLFFAVDKPFNQKREMFVDLLLESGAEVDRARLPRHLGYPALRRYHSADPGVSSSKPKRRESADTVATSGTGQSGQSSWRRRFLLKN